MAKRMMLKAKDSYASERSSFTLRIPKDLLQKLDKIVERKPWVTRNSWILDIIVDKLEEETRY